MNIAITQQQTPVNLWRWKLNQKTVCRRRIICVIIPGCFSSLEKTVRIKSPATLPKRLHKAKRVSESIRVSRNV